MISKIFNEYSIYDDEDILLFCQKRIFKFLFLSLLVVGIIPYILSVSNALNSSQWDLIAIYTFFYIMGCCITFIKKIHFPLRVWIGLSGFYFLGVTSLLTSGLIGSARLYFICFCAFAAVFSNLKGGIFALLVNILTLTGFGLLFDSGILMPEKMEPVFELGQWFVYCGTFIFLCSAVAISLALLIKALEVNGKEFKLLLKNTTQMIWAMDEDQNITFVNAAVTPLFGYRQKEWINLPLNRFLNENDGKKFREKIIADKPFCMVATILHHNGTPVPVEISGNRLRHFSDRTTRYQGIIKDISELKQQREKQDKLKEKLKQAEKLKGLGILAGSVAHDLNNILSGIDTYPEILLMDARLEPGIEKGLNIIKESGQKASAVVSDLLTISRGARAEKEIISINSLLERYLQAHDFIKIKDSHPDVSIDLMTEPELLNIKGSYIHIEKSLMNLVLNAVEEVSDKPNGQVLISTSNVFLDSVIPGFENREQGEYVVLSVTDNGSGITESDQKKIFDPFYTRKEMGKSGTGLGLTVVWNALLDHNGYIDVDSSANGTTFDLIFPATRQEVLNKPKVGSFDEIKGQGQMILVVDDLKDQQDIALKILNNLGYKASAVDTGYEAVEFIKQNTVDLVILDMIMAPSISGLETYRLIKKVAPGQKAIIASGYSESKDVLTAQNLGAGSFVKKPYTILDMGIAVKEELEK